MLKTTPIQSAKNSPLSMDRAEDAEVGSGTSSTIGSAKNSSALVDMAEDVEVGKSDGNADEIVKQPFSKKSNVSTGYFTSLCFKKMSFP